MGDNVEEGVYSVRDALRIAKDMDLDLVEISSRVFPAICRVVNYSQFRYIQKKKKKEIQSKSLRSVVKEIRFGPNTSDHDFNFKLNHAKKFLQDGAKVRAYVNFFGRSIVYKERGEILLLRLAQDLEELAKVESMPRMEGRRMVLIIAPKAGRRN